MGADQEGDRQGTDKQGASQTGIVDARRGRHKARWCTCKVSRVSRTVVAACRPPDARFDHDLKAYNHEAHTTRLSD